MTEAYPCGSHAESLNLLPGVFGVEAEVVTLTSAHGHNLLIRAKQMLTLGSKHLSGGRLIQRPDLSAFRQTPPRVQRLGTYAQMCVSVGI